MKIALDKLGSFGAAIAAAACPVCFPKLAVIGALLGLGSLSAYEFQLFLAAQVLVLLAMAGHVLSFSQHRNRSLLTLAILGGIAVFVGLYVYRSEWLAYAGLAALIVSSSADLWLRLLSRMPATKITRESEITCPHCGHKQRESMPLDACQFFYDCKACGVVLRPVRGDCCVFCSYGSVKCPPSKARPHVALPIVHR